jgi:hypothetical protein
MLAKSDTTSEPCLLFLGSESFGHPDPSWHYHLSQPAITISGSGVVISHTVEGVIFLHVRPLFRFSGQSPPLILVIDARSQSDMSIFRGSLSDAPPPHLWSDLGHVHDEKVQS